eukprot:3568878-Amphidinium_carterae.1
MNCYEFKSRLKGRRRQKDSNKAANKTNVSDPLLWNINCHEHRNVYSIRISSVGLTDLKVREPPLAVCITRNANKLTAKPMEDAAANSSHLSANMPSKQQQKHTAYMLN